MKPDQSEPPTYLGLAISKSGSDGLCKLLLTNNFGVTIYNLDANSYQLNASISFEDKQDNIGWKHIEKQCQTYCSQLTGNRCTYYYRKKKLYIAGRLKRSNFTVVLKELLGKWVCLLDKACFMSFDFRYFPDVGGCMTSYQRFHCSFHAPCGGLFLTTVISQGLDHEMKFPDWEAYHLALKRKLLLDDSLPPIDTSCHFYLPIPVFELLFVYPVLFINHPGSSHSVFFHPNPISETQVDIDLRDYEIIGSTLSGWLLMRRRESSTFCYYDVLTRQTTDLPDPKIGKDEEIPNKVIAVSDGLRTILLLWVNQYGYLVIRTFRLHLQRVSCMLKKPAVITYSFFNEKSIMLF